MLAFVSRCDHSGRGNPLGCFYAGGAAESWFENESARCHVLSEKPKPLVKGQHLIDTFNLPPGKEMGRRLGVLFDEQLSGGFSTTEEGLARYRQLFPG
jgi:hypothetical protein